MVEHWIRAASPLRLAAVVEARGLDRAALLEAAGVPALPSDPNQRIPLSVHFALWAAAMRALKDPSLPVEVGQSLTHRDFDVAGYAAHAAATLDLAFGVIQRFGRLHANDTGFERTQEEGGVRIYLKPSGPLPLSARCATETVMVQTVHIARELAGVRFLPLEVTFRHPAPSRTATHEAFFGLVPRFEAELASVLIANVDLDRPVLGADEGLHRLLVRHAEAALEALSPGRFFRAEVQRAVARRLPAGAASIGQVARDLASSPRTLRRRLDEEKTSFREIVDEVRRETAIRYLQEEKLSVDEVALLVGFSDGRAFRRAFHRWTGRAPAEHRETARGPA